MERKELYEVPSATVVEVKFEGVICSSADYITPFNNEEIW